MAKLVEAKRRIKTKETPQDNSATSTQPVVDSLQTTAQDTAVHTTKTVYQQGKKLAQRSYTKRQQKSKAEKINSSQRSQSQPDTMQDTHIRTRDNSAITTKSNEESIVEGTDHISPSQNSAQQRAKKLGRATAAQSTRESSSQQATTDKQNILQDGADKSKRKSPQSANKSASSQATTNGKDSLQGSVDKARGKNLKSTLNSEMPQPPSKSIKTRPQASEKGAIKTRSPSKLTIRKKELTSGSGRNAVASQAKSKAQKRVQAKMRQQAIQKSAQSTKLAAKGAERIKAIVIQATKAVVKMAVGLLGGAGAVIALVVVIGGVAAVFFTPFGVFWSGESDSTSTETMPVAVATINSEFSEILTQIQTDNPSDSVEIYRVPDVGDTLAITNWADVVAVFAVKTAGATTDATDVIVIDDSKIALLTEVFWDMNIVTHSIETIEHPATEDSEAWTETILHITITSKTYDEMGVVYDFSTSQDEALTEMMQPEYAQLLAELVGTYGGELTLTDEEIAAMMERLPEDLSPERLAVVETAYSLLGQVGYFWGGKSSAIGWDSRWGTPTTVTAAGSSTTGTIRPFGLDCSGFVDWVFNNAVGYVIGQGGGASAQHGQCTTITWAEATAGDLVFYPNDTHVGIYVGLDENNEPLIIHCASSQNNVVITGLQGFTSIARPNLDGF